MKTTLIKEVRLDMEKDGRRWILKWLISRLINSLYVWGPRQDTGPTDSHRGTLMTNILLHSARDAPCITSASHSCPASSYSLFLLRKTSFLSVPLSHTLMHPQLSLQFKRRQGSLHIFFLLVATDASVHRP